MLTEIRWLGKVRFGLRVERGDKGKSRKESNHLHISRSLTRSARLQSDPRAKLSWLDKSRTPHRPPPIRRMRSAPTHWSRSISNRPDGQSARKGKTQNKFPRRLQTPKSIRPPSGTAGRYRCGLRPL